MIRLDYTRGAKELSRQEFCAPLRRSLAERFPDETLEKISSPPTWNIHSRACMPVEFCGAAKCLARFSLFRSPDRKMPWKAV